MPGLPVSSAGPRTTSVTIAQTTSQPSGEVSEVSVARANALDAVWRLRKPWQVPKDAVQTITMTLASLT